MIKNIRFVLEAVMLNCLDFFYLQLDVNII